MLDRLAVEPDVRKVGPRDLATCAVSGAWGATTVAGTLAVCAVAGIHFMATGGIGGVHRGWAETRDVSADLDEIAPDAVCVVCSGAKSLLDIPATLETLETLGVPLIGYRTDVFPLFYVRESRHPVPDRADDADAIAAAAAAHWGFARSTGAASWRSPSPRRSALDAADLERTIEDAVAEAAARRRPRAGRDAARAGRGARGHRRALARGQPAAASSTTPAWPPRSPRRTTPERYSSTSVPLARCTGDVSGQVFGLAYQRGSGFAELERRAQRRELVDPRVQAGQPEVLADEAKDGGEVVCRVVDAACGPRAR